jgi:hypothetical protein
MPERQLQHQLLDICCCWRLVDNHTVKPLGITDSKLEGDNSPTTISKDTCFFSPQSLADRNDVAGLLSWVEKLWSFYTAVVGLSSIIGPYSEMFVQMLENGLN